MVPLLEQVLEKNRQSVKIVFKNFPLPNHDLAGTAALAALAAGEQGKFWEYHDMLFTQKKITKSSFQAIAEKLQLDLDTFKSDMQSLKLRSYVERDLAEGRNIGVSGTPTVYVNGRKLRQKSLQGFQQRIDEELKIESQDR